MQKATLQKGGLYFLFLNQWLIDIVMEVSGLVKDALALLGGFAVLDKP